MQARRHRWWSRHILSMTPSARHIRADRLRHVLWRRMMLRLLRSRLACLFRRHHTLSCSVPCSSAVRAFLPSWALITRWRLLRLAPLRRAPGIVPITVSRVALSSSRSTTVRTAASPALASSAPSAAGVQRVAVILDLSVPDHEVVPVPHRFLDERARDGFGTQKHSLFNLIILMKSIHELTIYLLLAFLDVQSLKRLDDSCHPCKILCRILSAGHFEIVELLQEDILLPPRLWCIPFFEGMPRFIWRIGRQYTIQNSVIHHAVHEKTPCRSRNIHVFRGVVSTH